MGATDIIIIIIFFIAVAMTAILGYMVMQQLQTPMENAGFSHNVIEKVKTSMNIWDYLSVIMVGILVISTAITSYQIKTHPVFAVFTIFLIAIEILISTQFVNFFIFFLTSSPMIATAADDFPLMLTITPILPLIGLIAGALGMILAYGKPPAAPEGGSF